MKLAKTPQVTFLHVDSTLAKSSGTQPRTEAVQVPASTQQRAFAAKLGHHHNNNKKRKKKEMDARPSQLLTREGIEDENRHGSTNSTMITGIKAEVVSMGRSRRRGRTTTEDRDALMMTVQQRLKRKNRVLPSEPHDNPNKTVPKYHSRQGLATMINSPSRSFGARKVPR